MTPRNDRNAQKTVCKTGTHRCGLIALKINAVLVVVADFVGNVFATFAADGALAACVVDAGGDCAILVVDVDVDVDGDATVCDVSVALVVAVIIGGVSSIAVVCSH